PALQNRRIVVGRPGHDAAERRILNRPADAVRGGIEQVAVVERIERAAWIAGPEPYDAVHARLHRVQGARDGVGIGDDEPPEARLNGRLAGTEQIVGHPKPRIEILPFRHVLYTGE